MLCRRRASKNPEFQLMYMCKALQGCPGTRPGVHVNMLEIDTVDSPAGAIHAHYACCLAG